MDLKLVFIVVCCLYINVDASKSKPKCGSHSDSKSGSHSDSKSGPHSDSKSGSDSDSKSGSHSDSKSGSDSDSKSGSHSDSKSDSKSGSHSDSKSGSDSDSKSGSDSDSTKGAPSFCMCKRYEVHCAQGKEMYSKDEAQKFCEGLDPPGTLANLKTKEIDDAVRNFIMEKEMDNQDCVKYYGFWIGLGDAEEEGKYVWSDGDPMCENSYTNWAPGEPDNNDKHDPNGQDCVQLWFRNGHKLLWDDEYCNYRAKGLVCEIATDCCGSS